MIIGISGKIGSGKDFVGNAIQLFTLATTLKIPLEEVTPERIIEFMESKEGKSLNYGLGDYEIKKFADKLKDIVCLLIGCTREQLEDRDFKERGLSSEWDMYELHWSDGWDGQMSIVPKDFDKSLYLDKKGVFNGELTTKISMTPRKLLQLLGTEAGRQIIHPNIWVNALMSEYKYTYKGGIDIGGESIEVEDKYPNWVITDMRFPNELEAVKSRKGLTIRIVRPETDHLAGNHASETALDDAKFDVELNNNGTLQDLVYKIRGFLVVAGII